MVKLLTFSDFVEFQLKCFKVLGLDLSDDRNKKSWRVKLSMKVYHYFLITNLTLYLATTPIFIRENIKDLNLLTEIATSVGFGWLAIVKVLSIPANRETFTDLMKTLIDMFPKTEELQSSYEIYKYFHGVDRMRNIISSLYCSSGIVLSLSPIFIFVTTGNWFDKLPLLTWYPFNEHDPRVYNFILIWQWCCLFTIHVSILAADVILYTFITLISMQFHNLCKRLKEINNSESNDADEKLIELIKIHKVLIRISQNLEQIFSVSVFFNFFGSSIFVCLFGYQITVRSSFENTMKNAVLLATSLSQIFTLCYYGNKLVTASGEVAHAAYASKWYGKGLKNSKNLIWIIQKAQKPNVLTAFKFSVVSLDVYSSVSPKLLNAWDIRGGFNDIDLNLIYRS